MQISQTERVVGVFFFYILAALILIINLFRIQVINSNFFISLGQQQYQAKITTVPPREIILDRYLKPLAINKQALSAFIIPNNLENPEAVKKFLKLNFEKAYSRLEEKPNAQFMYIKRRINSEEYNLIKDSNLSDICILSEPSRYYPVMGTASLLGITNIDNTGLSGIELLYDKELTSPCKTEILEKDARSGYFYSAEIIDTNKDNKKNNKKSLILTIDSVLQFLVYQELKETINSLQADSGSVIIVDPTNGDILSLVNYPEFDTNNLEKISTEQLKNQATSSAYELGSVIKLFLALAALEENIVTPEQIIDCEDTTKITLDKFSFTTWKAHGKISFSDVIKFSNNIGVAKVAQNLGPKLYDHYKSLGFGKKCGIFPGENSGFINPPNLWSKASIITLSFGYEISATIVQLAQALTVLASDGHLVKLRLNKNSPIEKTQRIYSSQTINATREILKETIEEGTAKNAKIPDFTVMGKTGTARLLTNGKYDPNRCIYTFAGLIEHDNYKRIIVTFVKEAKVKNAFASTIAVPLFKKIAQKMIIHEQAKK